MILLRHQGHGGKHGQSCLLLGAGLIGSAVLEELANEGFSTVAKEDSHWHQKQRRERSFERMADRLSAAGHPLHIVWSAGTGSLASSNTALEPERQAFDETLEFARTRATQNTVTFHFISSAGALFEGQRRVDDNSRPAPGSPYGKMKLEQEQQLSALTDSIGCKAVVYRPSTVYGSHAFHRRAGLVSHVMWNALRAAPTTLEANLHALRDFVYCRDVGRYIASQITRPQSDSTRIKHLVSAKPSSILEVFHRIERLMGKSLFYQLKLAGTNNADITFSDRLLPGGWSPAPLEVGMAAVWRETRKAFLAEQPNDS